MDHTKRQGHIQAKRGPLSHRIVESISVLTESGLRNTVMLSRERLSWIYVSSFKNVKREKHTEGFLENDSLTIRGITLPFVFQGQPLPPTVLCYSQQSRLMSVTKTTGELPVSLQAMQKSHLPEANSDYAAQMSPSVQTMIFSRTYPRVITEYTLNNATRTTSTSEVVLFANGNTLLICLRIRI